MRIVPRLPSSWSTSAGPASMILEICGPTVVPNLAMKGMIATVIMAPDSLTASLEMNLALALKMAGLSMMPSAKA